MDNIWFLSNNFLKRYLLKRSQSSLLNDSLQWPCTKSLSTAVNQQKFLWDSEIILCPTNETKQRMKKKLSSDTSYLHINNDLAKSLLPSKIQKNEARQKKIEEIKKNSTNSTVATATALYSNTFDSMKTDINISKEMKMKLKDKVKKKTFRIAKLENEIKRTIYHLLESDKLLSSSLSPPSSSIPSSSLSSTDLIKSFCKIDNIQLDAKLQNCTITWNLESSTEINPSSSSSNSETVLENILERERKKIRHLLSQKLQLKRIPQLLFSYSSINNDINNFS